MTSKNGPKVLNNVVNSTSQVPETTENHENTSKEQSNSDPKPPNPKIISLKTDLRNIMHAFGDSSDPIDASIDMMEMILRLELGGFLYLCDSAVAITGSKVLGLREAIFTMKNEKHRLLRLFKYFATKDHQMKLVQQSQMNSKIVYFKSYVLEIRSIIESMDETGEMMQLLMTESGVDTLKTEKALRADRLNLRSTLPLYVSYAKARSWSFARKLTLLQDWIRMNLRSEYRLSQSFLEVMAFLTYELVAHVIGLTFLIRREKFGYSNPIMRLCDPRGANPDTCTSAPAFQLQKKRKDDDCNNISEILVQASEMEAKRMKKASANGTEVESSKGALSLTPDEIQEAYNRLQAHGHTRPSQSYKSRADRLKKLYR